MTKSMYDALALMLSYLFMVLGIAIVLCGAVWARRSHKAQQSETSDVGLEAVGFIHLVGGTSRRVSKRERFPVPIEGILGSARACDVRIPSAEIPGRAARLTLTKSGMLLSPVSRSTLRVDGRDFRTSVLLSNESSIEWGSLSFQLHLIDGACALDAASDTPDLNLDPSANEAPTFRRLFRVRRVSPIYDNQTDDDAPDEDTSEPVDPSDLTSGDDDLDQD